MAQGYKNGPKKKKHAPGEGQTEKKSKKKDLFLQFWPEKAIFLAETPLYAQKPGFYAKPTLWCFLRINFGFSGGVYTSTLDYSWHSWHFFCPRLFSIKRSTETKGTEDSEGRNPGIALFTKKGVFWPIMKIDDKNDILADPVLRTIWPHWKPL